MAELAAGAAAPLLTQRRIVAFWAPLAATWLMMSAEGPFLTALMARLPEAKFNLAAFGVAFSLAMLVEAPIIMIMSAAAALVHGRASFLALRRFLYSLNGAITAFMLVLLAPPVFRAVAQGAMGLPADVAALAHLGLALLLPWPAAIGYRRFYQGVLIRQGETRLVAYGTVVRLATMAAGGGALYAWTALPGIAVGAAALSLGVVCEAAASRVMAGRAVRRVLAGPDGPPLPLAAIARFYYPLARFAAAPAAATAAALVALAFSPLAALWLGKVAGLDAGLAAFAFVPLQLLCVMPALEVLLSWQRSLLMVEHRTALVTAGTAVEIGCTVAVLAFAIGVLDAVGVIASALAILVARIAANAFLSWRLAPPAGSGSG